MYATGERERGAFGYPLDRDKLTRVILDKYDMRKWHTLRPWNCVLVYGEGQKWALVNDEGVGVEAKDYDGTSVVWFSLERPGDGEVITLCGGDEIELTWNEVEQCRATDAEIVDLADFIRTFGYRLDRNHRLWWSFSQAFRELETV